MADYFYVGGMLHPYWWVEDTERGLVADNRAAETDMGQLYDHEFAAYFGPRAMPITEQEYRDGSVTLEEWMAWYLAEQNKQLKSELRDAIAQRDLARSQRDTAKAEAEQYKGMRP